MERSKAYQLLKYYLEHRFSSDVEEELQRWIIAEGREHDKEDASRDFWNEISDDRIKINIEAFKRVNKRIGRERLILRKTFLKIAAVLVPLLVLSLGYYFRPQETPELQIVAGYGEMKQVVLPDGSFVRLNAGSVLAYPKEFSDKERIVNLSGEGWFEIVNDSNRPFSVVTKELSVNVLGTRFNLRAYPDEEQTIATLSSGKVRVDIPDVDSRVLEPDEQLIYYSHSRQLIVQPVDAGLYAAWISGEQVFIHVPLPDIFKSLERNYDVRIRMNSKDHEEHYNIKFLRQDSIEQIMTVLSELAQFRWSKKENIIQIEKE